MRRVHPGCASTLKLIADSGGTVSSSPAIEAMMGHGFPVPQLVVVVGGRGLVVKPCRRRWCRRHGGSGPARQRGCDPPRQATLNCPAASSPAARSRARWAVTASLSRTRCASGPQRASVARASGHAGSSPSGRTLLCAHAAGPEPARRPARPARTEDLLGDQVARIHGRRSPDHTSTTWMYSGRAKAKRCS